ncbi:MAG: hypothetical protein J6S73_09735 [Lentisphaeria bacterium]|nr:hypothetical protein [Lentisphaeria bacterium]
MKTRIIKNILFAGMILLAMLGELLAGRIGWILPLIMPVLYFISLNISWYKAGFLAIFLGALLDLALGRNFPVSIPALLLMLLAAYRLRQRHPSELPDIFASVLGAMAAAEAVYALASAHAELTWTLLLQWGILSLCGFVLTLLIVQAGRILLNLLEIQDCFTPRSTLWKRRRIQHASSRSGQV